jgi:hypothetical protein
MPAKSRAFKRWGDPAGMVRGVVTYYGDAHPDPSVYRT